MPTIHSIYTQDFKELKKSGVIALVISIISLIISLFALAPHSDKMSLQAKCSDAATKYFISKGYKKEIAYTYVNHFNSKLDKCFILISYYADIPDSTSIDLYDALEGKHYASYLGYNNCTITATKCQLNSGNIWLDGNDTKPFSDYHVGFQGAAIGPGVGDENTQKQFLEHIQPFMND